VRYGGRVFEMASAAISTATPHNITTRMKPDGFSATTSSHKGERTMKQFLNLVGMKYRPPADLLVPQIPTGTEVLLVREPGNAHDPNAIAVYLHLGYIKATQAFEIAERIDMSQDALAKVKGRFVANFWPKIEIDV